MQQSVTPSEPDKFLDETDLAKFQKMVQQQNLVAWGNKQFERCKTSRQAQETQWYKNIAAYGKGNKVIVNRQANGAPMANPNPKAKDTIWVNRIRPFVRSEIARITSNKPQATVVPATADDDDFIIAETAEQVWENQYKEEGVDAEFMKTAWWLVTTGSGFIKTWWDKNAIDNRVEPDPLLGFITPGAIKYGNTTPFNLWVPDLLETDLENELYLINAYTKPIEWVEMFYGPALSAAGITSIKADANSSSEIINESQMGIKNSGDASNKDSVLIKEFWVKPGATKLLPQGGMFTVVNNKVIQASLEGLPYTHGQYPFAKFDNIPTGGFYSASGIEDIEPLNREYNELRNMIRQVGKLNTNPQYLYVKGSTNPKRITNRPGQWIPIQPGMQFPYPVPKQDVPNSVMNGMMTVLTDIEDISGQHQVSKGSAPPGVTAATAINYLQEKDDSYISTMYSSIEKGIEKVAKQTLSLANTYWNAERLIPVIGQDDGVMSSLIVSGDKLSRGTNVRIDAGTSMPQSPAAKRSWLLEMLQMGVIDQSQFLDLADIGGTKSITDVIKRDKRQAQRENIKFRELNDEYLQIYNDTWKDNIAQMLQNDPEQFISMQLEEAGISAEDFAKLPPEEQDKFLSEMEPPSSPGPIPVNDWDNHQVHIEEHNNFRKTQAFEMLPDSVKEILDDHVAMHRDALSEDTFSDMLSQGQGLEGMDSGDAALGKGILPDELFKLNQQNTPQDEEQPVDDSQPSA